MTSVASLNVNIRGNRRPLSREMRMAQRDAERFRKNLVNQFKRIGVGTVALGAAFAALTVKVSSQFDDIAKSARNIGVGTEEFSQLSFALGQFGLEQPQFTRGILTLSKAIGEAGLGAKSYTEALDLVGLSYRDLAALRPEEQYLRVIDALGDVADQNARTVAGNRLLGGSYRQLGSAVEAGSDSIRALASSVVAVDTEAAAAFEALNDAVDRAGTSFTTTFGNAFAGSGAVDELTMAINDLEPAIEILARALGLVGRGISSLVEGITRGINNQIDSEVARLEDLLIRQQIAAQSVGGGFGAEERAVATAMRLSELATEQAIRAAGGAISTIPDAVAQGVAEGVEQGAVAGFSAAASQGLGAGLIDFDFDRDYAAPLKSLEETVTGLIQTPDSLRFSVEPLLRGPDPRTVGDFVPDFDVAGDANAAIDALVGSTEGIITPETFMGFGLSIKENLRTALLTGNFDDLGQALLTSVQAALIDGLLGSLFSSIGGSLFGGFGGGAGAASGAFITPGESGRPVPIIAHGGELILNGQQTRELLGGQNRGTVFNQTFNQVGDVTRATRRAVRQDARFFADQVNRSNRERRVFGGL